MTARAGMIRTIPSRRKAVFSDVNALVCVSDSLARYGSISVGCEAMAASRPRSCTPLGSPSSRDNCGANRPLTHTACAIGALSACVCGIPPAAMPSFASAKVRSAIGATLVKRHCSIFVVGNPRRSNCAIALSRACPTQRGCAAPCSTDRRYSAV